MTEILIASAAASNYEGMDALVGEDGRVYLGRSENYCPGDGEAPAFYDNSDNSLQLISDNIKMFHFLYGEGWPVSQRQMRRERCFTKADYIEFASLRDGVLSHYRPIREVTFAGRPFVPPKAYCRMHRARPPAGGTSPVIFPGRLCPCSNPPRRPPCPTCPRNRNPSSPSWRAPTSIFPLAPA